MGRKLQPDWRYAIGPYAGSANKVRRRVLADTVERLADPEVRARALSVATANVARWRQQAAPGGPVVRVIGGDWGQVTADLTREHGEVFAALNMANAHVPGGGYVEGCPAQEENMFRRTDCHFAVGPHEMNERTEHYLPEVTALIEGADGRVLLDVEHPRVCVRGPEDRSREDLGYAWLPEDQWFPFYELRAAAVDLRGWGRFDPDEMGRRVTAQLDTLIDANVRHAVLSAFGCGAFRNPAAEVARLYRDALAAREGAFDCVAFAIFDPGYGPDNLTPFREVLR